MDKENMLHIYSEILLSYKNKEIIPFAASWMDLEIIILSEVRDGATLYDVAYVWNLKNIIQINLFTKQK